MLLIVGGLTVIVCVIGGFIMMDGHIEILIQPVEFIIIAGASIGAFIIANPKTVIKASIKASIGLLKPPRHNEAAAPSSPVKEPVKVEKVEKVEKIEPVEKPVENIKTEEPEAEAKTPPMEEIEPVDDGEIIDSDLWQRL